MRTQKCKSCASLFCESPVEQELRVQLAPQVAGSTIPLPHPQLCPDCRMQRRLIWRNELNLFHSKDHITGSDIITFIPPVTTAKVITVEAWHGDTWNELDYGRDFDFKRPFFEQFQELLTSVPLIALANIRCQNSDYANCAAECKNCYLIGGANICEDCLYGNYVNRSKNCVDNNFIDGCELCYECIDCRECYRASYCQNSNHCTDSHFLYQCRNVKDSFGCVNLSNVQYCFFNEQLSESEYRKVVSQVFPASRTRRKEVQTRFDNFKLRFPHRAYQGERLENVTGSSINGSRHSYNCFDATDLDSCSNCAWLHSAKNCMDIFSWGMSAELCYECLEVGDDSYRVLFSSTTWSSSEILYCYLTKSSRNCFGSVGLRGKNFCILNKQYTEAEYHSLLHRIVSHMQSSGEWGEFFPMSVSPHAYNTSVADDYYPLSQDSALLLGAKWLDGQTSSSKMGLEEIPDTVPTEPSQYLKKTYLCEKSGRPFKFVAPELSFYRDQNIPLPSTCFQERHRERLRRRAPRHIWERSCAKCNQKVQSVFSPSRPEIVYCPECFSHELA